MTASTRDNSKAAFGRLTIGLWLVLLAGTVEAQPPTKPPTKPPPSAPAGSAQAKPQPTCLAACESRSAIDAVVRAIATGVRKAPPKARVFVGPLVSDAKAPRGDALLAKLVEQVAGRLGSHVEHVAEPVTRDEARSRAHDVRGFLYLEVAIAGGRLRVTADAYPVPRSVWAKARAAKPGPVAHAQAHAPIDAEVRSYLEPLGFEAAPHVAKYTGADPEILALACGDLDGDGASELLTMTRQRVLEVRLVGTEVTPIREAKWDALAPIAPVPLREPFGFATIVEGPAGYVDVSLTDRAGSVRLDGELALVKALKGTAVPHGGATACTDVENLLLGKGRVACSATDAAPALTDVRHPTDALASMFVIGKDGAGRVTVALRKNTTLVVHDDDGDKIIARVGAQLAMGDVDQDGAPEVLSTVDTLAPKFDAVEVRSLLARGTVKKRMKLPVADGVRAVAVCPPDGPLRAPVVIATGTEIWVVR